MELFSKGSYKKIDKNFLIEGAEVLSEVSKIQEKYNKKDTDTFINELHDSLVGYYLGYELVNTNKHGFDCKKSRTEDVFLEVKAASYMANSWQATFNDTNYEKADSFKLKNVYLCLAVWKDAGELLFLVYGQNKEIGEFLHNKVDEFKVDHKQVRSTQSISLQSLVFDYDFEIITINKTKEEILKLLTLKNRRFTYLQDNKILNLKEYYEKYNISVKD